MELKPENDPVVGALHQLKPEKPAELNVPAQRPVEVEPEAEVAPLPTLKRK